MSLPVSKENGLPPEFLSRTSSKHSLEEAQPTRKRLRRQNAFSRIEDFVLNNQPTSFLREHPKLEKRSISEILLIRADDLVKQNALHEARDVLLRIIFKDGPVLLALQEINRRIKTLQPIVIKEKKSIPQKLKLNLAQAKQQQREEGVKKLCKHAGTIPDSFTYKKLPTRPLMNESTQIAGRMIGIAHCQGVRATMEDAFLAIECAFRSGQKVCKGELYAVFDGHGGTETSHFLSKHFAAYFISSLEHENEAKLTDEGIYTAFRKTFANLDDACVNYRNGSTATVALVLEDRVWVANCGDSRTILSDHQVPVQMSQDAKLNHLRFQRKVEKLGGTFEECPGGLRIQKLLAVAGSIGDRYVIGEEGNCCVPAQPQVTVHPFKKDDGFLLLGCDGYFDIASTNETVAWVEELRNNNEPVEDITKRLVYSALISCTEDNVTLILVPL